MDLRGHGGSGKPWKTEAYLGSKPWADDVQSVIAALALNKPLLVGWSFGGCVAMDYGREHGSKSVSGVVLVGSHGGLLPRPAANGPPATGDLETLQTAARQTTRQHGPRRTAGPATAGSAGGPGSERTGNTGAQLR
jgi:pimeloyl-ACP methyl ester carboxylesterase